MIICINCICKVYIVVESRAPCLSADCEALGGGLERFAVCAITHLVQARVEKIEDVFRVACGRAYGVRWYHSGASGQHCSKKRPCDVDA